MGAARMTSRRRRAALFVLMECEGGNPMDSMIDSLFDQYERGRMTRRHLVQALAVLALPERAAQGAVPASTPIVRGLSVNHVALTVSDVPRSFAFYERLFGVTRGWPATDA